jgi:hypothetical protein
MGRTKLNELAETDKFMNELVIRIILGIFFFGILLVIYAIAFSLLTCPCGLR